MNAEVRKKLSLLFQRLLYLAFGLEFLLIIAYYVLR